MMSFYRVLFILFSCCGVSFGSILDVVAVNYLFGLKFESEDGIGVISSGSFTVPSFSPIPYVPHKNSVVGSRISSYQDVSCYPFYGCILNSSRAILIKDIKSKDGSQHVKITTNISTKNPFINDVYINTMHRFISDREELTTFDGTKLSIIESMNNVNYYV